MFIAFLFCLALELLIPVENLTLNSNYKPGCLNSSRHKSSPEPEDSLHGQCSSWKSRSCCSSNTTFTLHSLTLYKNFNFTHCGDLRPSCKRHFIQDSCFYECSPNVWPWIINLPVSTKGRKQRFKHVPLCKSECDSWFNDCRYDKTCFMNWAVELNKQNCSKDCVTFETMFENATNFCQKVWDDSWLVAADDKPCMKFWFEGENPNDKVAAYYANISYENATIKSGGKDKASLLIPILLIFAGIVILGMICKGKV